MATAEIKNLKELVENAETDADRRARELALSALNMSLEAASPKEIVKSKVKFQDSIMKVEGRSFNLKEFRKIFVIGGGKASALMAEALEELIGTYITNGIVNIPYSSPKPYTKKIRIQYASHPVPDTSGVKGVNLMLKLADLADERDLIICLLSGGGSSLLAKPCKGITLKDKKTVTKALLKSGASINEINTVRKHLSSFKGGWLARHAYPATVLTLILSDVVGDPLDTIASGPTVSDPTTYHDAVEILKTYELWNRIPVSVKKVLLGGKKGLVEETPKIGEKVFTQVHNIVIGNNYISSLAAYDYFVKNKLNVLNLSSCLQGEARDIGGLLASLVREICLSGYPISRPAAVVAGGETTVHVVGDGKGGRNQEVVLGAVSKIDGINGVAVASLSTDGIDGPTVAAGAITDGKTLLRASRFGLVPKEFLARNDSYHFFNKLDDLIITGLTGTNVCDVSVIVVL